MAMTTYLTSYTDTDEPGQDTRTLRSFESEDVIPFLKQHLQWIITRTNSEVIDHINMIKESHLKVSVWDRIFEPPTPEYRLSLYHPAELHHDITVTQPGGLGYQYA